MKKIKLPFDLQLDLLEGQEDYAVGPMRLDGFEWGRIILCAEGLRDLWELPSRLPKTMWFHVAGASHQDCSDVQPVYCSNRQDGLTSFRAVLLGNNLGYSIVLDFNLTSVLQELCDRTGRWGFFVSLQYEEEV